MRYLLLICFLMFALPINAQESSAVELDQASDTKAMIKDIPVYPKPIYLPFILNFAEPFTGKVQITTLEGREVVHAELTDADSLPLPPGGLNGEYVLRLINLETEEVLYDEKITVR